MATPPATGGKNKECPTRLGQVYSQRSGKVFFFKFSPCCGTELYCLQKFPNQASWTVALVASTRPPIVVCKMEAWLEYIHIAYTFCTLGADLYAVGA